MVGQKIGRYKVVRLIGKGGMGLVYEALDEEIERRAAIKILHAQFSADAEMGARFLNEARAVNIIQHPSLVAAFEFGKLPDGSAYIVMEYLEGETLRQRIKSQGRLGPDAVRICRQIASALCAAHAKHITHRDLKPSNIMIVPDPDMVGGERVKVLDFGIAKLAANQVPGQVDTRTGAILGSPGYMSPEQCRNVSTVDERSDIYSLGIILYEMLMGRPPFSAESDAEILALHLYAEATPLNQVDPEVDTALSQFVQRMLAKQPAERPTSPEVLSFLNQQAGFPSSSSMPLPILKPVTGRLSGPIVLTPLGAQQNESDTHTLSRASGQDQSSAINWRSRRIPIAVGVSLIMIVGLIVIVSRDHSQTGHAQVVVPALDKVRWQISSTPSGAEIVRKSDQQVLGRTPLNEEFVRAAGSEALILRLAGFVDTPITLDRSASRELSVALIAAATAAGDSSQNSASDDGKARSRSRRDTGRSGDKRKGSKVTNNADIELIR